MSFPLYHELQSFAEELDHLRKQHHSKGHAGLWFERFYNRYPDDYTDTKKNENDFLEWLNEFKLAGNQSLLDQALARQFDLVEQLNGQCVIFKSPWHYVSGMGYPHPLENGFNWHPVLGVPYLPGSGLKGLVRSWVEAWTFDPENQQAQKKACLLVDWFGSEKKDDVDAGDQQTGKVVFFDALPIDTVKLAVDVMTPHMGDWYAQGDKIRNVNMEPDKIPADWHSPKPVYFLSAQKPAFLVSIAPRNKAVAQDVDMAEVMQYVQYAFEWLGAGAKTAVGYGQFEKDEVLSKDFITKQRERKRLAIEKKQQAEALAGLSGVARKLIEYSQKKNWEGDKNAFLAQGERRLESWLEEVAEEPDPAALAHLRMLFKLHFAKPDLLSNPAATGGKKNKPLFKPRTKALGEWFLEIERGVK